MSDALAAASAQKQSSINIWGERVVIALIAATLITSLFIPADSISVYEGESLPQIMLILITCTVATLSGLLVLPTTRRPLELVLLSIGMLGLMVSTWNTVGNSDVRAALNGFWHVVSLVVFGLLTRAIMVKSNSALPKTLMTLLLMMAVYQATYALHQYFVSLPEARAAYLRDPESELLRAGINAPPGSELRSQYESRLLGSSEPTGTFALTNSLAVPLSAALLALGMVLLAQSQRFSVENRASDSVADRASVQKKASNKDKKLNAGAISYKDKSLNAGAISYREIALGLVGLLWVMMGIAWLLTKSRTAYLAVGVVGMPAIFLLSSQGRVHLAGGKLRALVASLGLVALVVAIALVGLLVTDKLVLSEAPKSIAFRLEYWRAATRMVFDHPLTGVGLGNFQSYYPRYKVPEASEIIADPHNWIFDIAACSSIIVLAVAIVAIGRMLIRCVRGLSAAPSVAEASVAEASKDATASADSSALWLWLGAGVGYVLTAIMLMLVGQVPDLEAAFLSLLSSFACIWAMHWISIEPQSLKLSSLSAGIVMLLCLLATGSWQASGIALPWLCWVVLAAPVSPWSIANNAQRALQSGICLLALGAFYVGTWQPVNTAWVYEQQSARYWGLGDMQRAESALRQAIEIDRYSTSARATLVQVLSAAAERAASTGKLDEFRMLDERLQQASQDMTRADQASYLTWTMRSENSITLAAAVLAHDKAAAISRMVRAEKESRAASERYPSSVSIWASRAVVLGWLARHVTSANPPEEYSQLSREASEHAFQLSAATPHSNRQIAAQQVWLPEPLAAGFPAESIDRPVAGSPWAKAEPLCNLLRN